MNFKFSKIDIIVFGILFALLTAFLVHNFDSIGQDIGRHLKIGEIIWQTKEAPKTNLFSFTEPDFPFINHHWLSEVIFFGIFSKFGFTGLILLKVFLVLATFLILFFLIKKYAKFWPLLISFLLSIFIFIQRTEVRPEIFSFFILAFFLFVLFKVKYPSTTSDVQRTSDVSNYRYLWFLPLAQLLWVNLHIYFFIGPIIFLFFLIDRTANKKINPKSEALDSKQYQNYNNSNPKLFGKFKFSIWNLFRISNLEFRIFILVILATLINPAGIKGALLPFNILKEYGYSIVENQTLSFLAAFFGFNLSIFVFKLSAVILAALFILNLKKTRQRFFEVAISAFFIYAGFRMLRNLPLYALVSFPILAILLTDVFGKLTISDVRRLSGFFKVLISGFLIFLIFFIATNRYYSHASLSREFGFSVPNGLERAADFVKNNKIEGPMFNNFDIGGYLIWKLYPNYKVFVDNRPEAYSVKFFSEVYKPMQEDEKKWAEFSEKYGINYVLFGHTDATPWGQAFLKKITKNPNWKTVYINENAIILLKNNSKNKDLISSLAVSDKNAAIKTEEYLKDSNKNAIDLNLIMARVFYGIDWREPSIYFAEKVLKINPENPQANLYKGLVHAFYTDMESQELAAESIARAIDLGLKESQYYAILGVINMNLGRFADAERLFKKALELDENNEQARKFLEKYFNN